MTHKMLQQEMDISFKQSNSVKTLNEKQNAELKALMKRYLKK